MRRSWQKVLGLCLAAACAAPSVAAAQASAAVREARHALRSYDTEGSGTTDAIARLGAAAGAARDASHRREARYLRAVAATDLLVIAERTANDALRARVAEAVGVPDAHLERTLRAELASLTFGAYGEAARDAREGLAVLSALRSGAAPSGLEGGERRGALLLEAIRVAAREGRLAELGADPCADGADCALPYALFDAEGRRAASVLRRAGELLGQLEEAAEHGDPLAVALRDVVVEDRIALQMLSVRAVPRLAGAGLFTVSGDVPRQAPDAVLVVTGDEVRWAWVPSIRLGDDGQPVAAASGGPALPAFERIALPDHMRPALLPIGPVHEALERIRATRPDARVAIGATDHASGQVLARVLLSVDRTGLERPLLVGVGPDGALRGVPMRVASERDPGYRRAPVRVRVRLGGYSLHTPAGSEDIPRVRDAADHLRFDVGTLAARADAAPADGAELSFMSAVATGPLMAAAFCVAPGDAPLTVALP